MTSETLVRVDRSKHIEPPGNTILLHPDLETLGPEQYDLKDIKLWVHRKQELGGLLNGIDIYNHLKETDGLKKCLGIHDAREIQKMSMGTYRKFFGHNMLTFWRSTACDVKCHIYVPVILVMLRDRLYLTWISLSTTNRWGLDCSAPRFRD